MPRLFEGQTFYLARSLHTDERRRANNLILTHGGKVTKDTQTKSVKTVVDSRALASKNNPGTWVPAELIFESVELGELQPLEKYHSTPAQKGKAIRRRVKYTVEDDVRMLDFLETLNEGRLPAFNEYVPIRAWEIGATQEVTKHSAASMNEHYRKILNKWTPQQRRNAIENAKKLKSSSREEAVEPVGAPVSTSSISPKSLNQVATLEPGNTRDEVSQATTGVVDAEEMTARTQENPDELEHHPTPKEIGIAIRSKVKFTDEDDARMLYFVQQRNGGKLPPTKSIPPAWWNIAVKHKVTKHSSESMRQRCRTILSKLTPVELCNAIDQGKLLQQQKEREESSSTREETISVSAAKANESATISSPKRKANTQVHPTSGSTDSAASIDTEDTSEPVRKRKKKTRATSSASDQSATEEATQLPSDSARVNEPESSKPADSSGAVSRDEPHVDEEVSDQEDSENRMEETPGGMVVHSYWEKRLAEATREELSQYLQPRTLAMPSVTNEQSPNDDHQTPEEPAVSTSIKRRSKPSSRATNIAVAGASATNESVVTTEDEAEKLISRIQLETGQHNDAVVHALYFSSGNVDAAISFLRGSSSPTFWDGDDDIVLQSWAREHETLPSAVIISAAMEKGAFAALSTARSVDAISKRLKFLS